VGNADEQQEAGAIDPSHLVAADDDIRPIHALHDRSHERTVTGASTCQRT
jgi:hypothetical protein